jgi:hypothetical protein
LFPKQETTVGLAHDPHQHDAVVLPMEQDGTFFSFMQVDSAIGLRVSNMLKHHGMHDKVREKTEETTFVLPREGASFLPLDSVDPAVPSLQLHSTFDIDAQRVPPRDATSRPIALGNRSWGSFRNSP